MNLKIARVSTVETVEKDISWHWQQEYKNGDVYFGPFIKDKRHGLGLLEYSPSNTIIAYYTGNFETDQKHGNGTNKLRNGDTYVGEFKNGTYHGTGTYIWKTGGIYEGYFENGKFNGLGIKHYTIGARYEGNWKDGKRHGFGLISFAANDSFNALSYEGFFENDEKSGNGTYKWKSGEKYVGYFKNDVRSGIGTYYYSDGDRYEGNWENGKRNGFGKLFSSDGSLKYLGNWKDSVQEDWELHLASKLNKYDLLL